MTKRKKLNRFRRHPLADRTNSQAEQRTDGRVNENASYRMYKSSYFDLESLRCETFPMSYFTLVFTYIHTKRQ